MAAIPKPEELANISFRPPGRKWMDTKPEFKEGTHCHAAAPKWLEWLDYPFPRSWSTYDEDWKLPKNWKEIFLVGFNDRLNKYRSLRLFMDICVRCGACADKCQFFLGTGDPKNMPVLRAELMRSLYRRYHTTAGKILGRLAGARELTEDVVKELYYYLYQCSECRRCSAFCPYGIDMADITILGRELLSSIGLGIEWAMASVGSCFKIGSHIGSPPHAFKDMLEFFADECEVVTGIRPRVPVNEKGHEILFIMPSGDYFADPGTFNCMGYLLLFEYLDLDYTISTFAAEGGNFGYFISHEMGKRLNAKFYAEAKRLGVKWILGGECGHMWRVINQYMDTWNGPADFLEEPVSPITGTKFENAKSTKMVHICEFTADLIKHGKLKLDPSRNAHIVLTFHDSCNPARGMGLLEEPRYIIKNVLPPGHFYEMPENTIREKNFCCGSGSGFNADEYLPIRLRGGFPRASAVRYVHEKYGVNHVGMICAIDRAVFPPLLDYWVPGVDLCGVHELVGNALVFPGERERVVDLRKRPLKGKEKEAEKFLEEVG
ncbi:MAG: (Fe-S)-binding protein [Deltaproteobacteria bacterium]|nr:(Fe-S)-binding protein [Deltaproteobacteria bacterium]